jgi:Cd2+/Zn2+-exporting ATPase/Cu+-exporting ATPase
MLSEMAPRTARLERDGAEIEVPVGDVRPGDVLIVRPGEPVPADGQVIGGRAWVDVSALTGEPMPLEAGPGAEVPAAGIVSGGALRVQAVRVGADTTFGRALRLVEEAEAHRSPVQLMADRFSGWFLPIVLTIAGLTLLVRRDPLAAAAVLVVACSCSIALATPVAVLASVGAAAKRGLLVKGGKYLELLARADTLLIDKTGTLTLGRPQITGLMPFAPTSEDELLRLAAGVERYSEHPLAEAVRRAAQERGLMIAEPQDFEARPGLGASASIDGQRVTVGSRRILADDWQLPAALQAASANGQTLIFVTLDGCPIGALAAADTLRLDAPAALNELRRMGFVHIELLTGDSESSARPLAEKLGLDCRAGLLPEDKIRIVRQHQKLGRTVVMIGDGINDAPALAGADVGIAIRSGAAGSVALEAAHIALLRDDWTLIPEMVQIARRTTRVIRGNLLFTAVYNLLGLSLAALGILPPTLAAAAQSLPDLGILANSSRLIRR